MIKVTHYTNSFISVESDNSILTCDPWIGITNDNGWFSYPLENKKKLTIKYLILILFIYKSSSL